ncbi:MAG: hypothetical protein IT378_10625 [Sandaracinaceae bacterium]|nr:hypothetical protein [Sandaracinaceae bacterium]
MASALADTIASPLEARSLEAALHAARTYRMRNPGDEDGKLVVEALELLMAQVWFGGSEEGERPDPRYAVAARMLEFADLEGAKRTYAEILAQHPGDDRARRLSMRVEWVKDAADGRKISVPPQPVSASPPAPAPVLHVPMPAAAASKKGPQTLSAPEASVLVVVEGVDFGGSEPNEFEDSTRPAIGGELPLSAFEKDDRTKPRQAAIPAAAVRPEARPDVAPEATRILELGDYELFDDEQELAAESTRVAQPSELLLQESASAAPPSLPAAPAPPALPQHAPEVTRIASASDLPLEELRRQIEKDADAELDSLIVEVERPAEPKVPAKRAAAPAPKPNEPRVPAREPERSIAIELDFDAVMAQPPVEPPPPAVAPAPIKPAPSPMARVRQPISAEIKIAGPSLPPVQSRAGPVVPPPPVVPGAPAVRPAATPLRVDEPIPPAPAPHAAPPPAAAPRAPPPPAADVHAPVDTREIALPPPAAAWEIREPGNPDDDSQPGIAVGEASWTGVRPFDQEPPPFEPGVEPVDADTWDEPTTVRLPPSPTGDEPTFQGTPQQLAEAHVARGELGEALRIYQDLAASRPDDPRLWARVAEIARLLQRSSPPPR